MKPLILTIGLMLVSASLFAEDTEQVLWDKTPIALSLAVGEERRVDFPAAVTIGMPSQLQSSLHTQSIGGSVYFTAQRPFSQTRVLIKEVDSGRVYLLDLTGSTEKTPSHTLVIQSSETSAAASLPDRTSNLPDFVSLTRFAAQQLYAPVRLLKATPGIRRTTVSTKTVMLLPGEAVEATPLMAWRAGPLYVTAVKLTNTGPRAITLDPRRLRGHWLSATFQHVRLHRAGSDADSTAVYLVSAVPFPASI